MKSLLLRLANSARVRRLGWWLLRTFRPVARFRDDVIVTRFADVREVLSRHQDFTVRRFGSRMRETAGDFFLGLDEGPERDGERRAAVEALERVPIEAVLESAQAAAEEAVREGAKAGILDVVKDVVEPAHLRVCEEHFGIPSPADGALLRWVQLLSWYIFNPWPSDADRERAIRAGGELRDQVSRVVRQRARTRAADSTVLDGLRVRGLAGEPLERTIAGLLAGALGPGPRLFSKAVDVLLGLPRAERRKLHSAARDGDVRTVRAYLLEAGRHDPEPSLIHRSCERDAKLPAEGGRPIPAGALLVCSIESALRDRRSIRRPRSFSTKRDPIEYMMFGHGIHWCIGRELGLAVLTGGAIPLFAHEGVRRARGRQGRLRNGPAGEFPEQNYPQHLCVTFGASR
jgi:cytochrome P450